MKKRTLQHISFLCIIALLFSVISAVFLMINQKYVYAAPIGDYYEDQWALHGEYGINVEGAWEITEGSESVRVGVIDSGISRNIDLIPNLDDGYDFYNDNMLTWDVKGGHGTLVAGIIAAWGAGDVVGVAPDATLVPLQTAQDTSGNGFSRNIELAEAIKYATDSWDVPEERIPILNYSIGAFA